MNAKQKSKEQGAKSKVKIGLFLCYLLFIICYLLI
jgi:hypothetical protein